MDIVGCPYPTKGRIYLHGYGKYLKTFIAITISFAILSGFILYKLNYSNYFVASWSANFIIAPFFYGYFIIKKFTDSLSEVNFVEKVLYTITILFGVFLIIIPCTSIFKLIGAGMNNSVDIISKGIYSTLGLTCIFLNKMVVGCFYNKIH